MGCLVRITSLSPESPPQRLGRTWLSILQCCFLGLLACYYGFGLAGRDGSDNRNRSIQKRFPPDEDGTRQIGHIPFWEFGVFVVETKNMKGWIFGGSYQRFLVREIKPVMLIRM